MESNNNKSGNMNDDDDLLADVTDYLNSNQKTNNSEDFDPNASNFAANPFAKSNKMCNNSPKKNAGFDEIEEENDNYRLAPSVTKKDKAKNNTDGEEKDAQEDTKKKDKLDAKQILEKARDAKQKIRESLNRSKISISSNKQDENDSSAKLKSETSPVKVDDSTLAPQDDDRPLKGSKAGYDLNNADDERPLKGNKGGYDFDNIEDERPLKGNKGGYDLSNAQEERPLKGNKGGYDLDKVDDDRPLKGNKGGYNLDKVDDERPLKGNKGGYDLDKVDDERPLKGNKGGYNLDKVDEDRPLKGNKGGYNLDKVDEDRPLKGNKGGYNLDNVEDERPLKGNKGGYDFSNADEDLLNNDIAPPKAKKTPPTLSSQNKNLTKKKVPAKVENIETSPKDDKIPALNLKNNFINDVEDKKPITGGGENAGYDFENADIPPEEGDDVEALTKGKLEDRLISKQWKVRKYAYLDQSKKVANGENDEVKANHGDIFTKILKDSNPGALEKGLDFMTEFQNNESKYDLKTTELVTVFIESVVGHFTKVAIKKSAIEFMCVLFEKSPFDDYKAGMIAQLNNAKKPIIIVNAFTFLDEILSNYGVQKLEMLKPFYKSFSTQCNSKNAKHKHAAMQSVKNGIDWMGESIIMMLTDIKKQQLDELNAYAKSPTPGPMQPKKGKKVGGKKQAKDAQSDSDKEDSVEEEPMFDMHNLDFYEMADPVDILKKYDEAWTEEILKKTKWTERKGMLDEFQAKAEKTAKFKPTDWGHFISLTKKLFMDKNQNVTISMIKCIGALAKGQRKPFTRDAKSMARELLIKMKDKNHRVSDVCMEAFDELYYCIGLDDIASDLNTIFIEKNPHQKLLVAKLIAKYLEKENEKAEVLFAKLKDSLKKNLDDGDSKVREGCASQLCEMAQYFGNDKMMTGIKFSDQPANKQKLLKGFFKEANVSKKTVVGKNDKPLKNDQKPQKEEVDEDKGNSAKDIIKKIPTKFTATKNFEDSHLDKEDALKKMEDNGFDESNKKDLQCSDWKKKVKALQALFELLESSISLSEEAFTCMQYSLKDFKEINPNVNKETFNVIIKTCDNLNNKKNEKLFGEKNCSIIIALMVERVVDGKYTELITQCMQKMCEFQSKKRILSHFQAGVKAKTMNLKLAKEVQSVFTAILSEEENWYELPVIELTDFVKSCIASSTQIIKQQAILCYKELYRTTKGKVNELKQFTEISDKHKGILENEVKDLEEDDSNIAPVLPVIFFK